MRLKKLLVLGLLFIQSATSSATKLQNYNAKDQCEHITKGLADEDKDLAETEIWKHVKYIADNEKLKMSGLQNEFLVSLFLVGKLKLKSATLVVGNGIKLNIGPFVVMTVKEQKVSFIVQTSEGERKIAMKDVQSLKYEYTDEDGKTHSEETQNIYGDELNGFNYLNTRQIDFAVQNYYGRTLVSGNPGAFDSPQADTENRNLPSAGERYFRTHPEEYYGTNWADMNADERKQYFKDLVRKYPERYYGADGIIYHDP